MMPRGGKDWYFLTVDYALGKGIEAEAQKYIEGHGGKVLGLLRSIRSAPPTSPHSCCRHRARKRR